MARFFWTGFYLSTKNLFALFVSWQASLTQSASNLFSPTICFTFQPSYCYHHHYYTLIITLIIKIIVLLLLFIAKKGHSFFLFFFYCSRSILSTCQKHKKPVAFHCHWTTAQPRKNAISIFPFWKANQSLQFHIAFLTVRFFWNNSYNNNNIIVYKLRICHVTSL